METCKDVENKFQRFHNQNVDVKNLKGMKMER